MANNYSELALTLKPVFDSCDQNGDGFVKIQDLISLGQQSTVTGDGRGEELESLLQQFDTDGDGQITFDEFTQKIEELFADAISTADLLEYDEASTDVDQQGEDTLHSPVASSPIKISADDVASSFQKTHQRARSHTDSEGFFEEGEDLSSHSTASTNEYYGDLDETINSPTQTIPNALPKHMSPPKRNIYLTYPPNGIHPKKNRPSLFEMNHRTLSRTSEYQSQEECSFGSSPEQDEDDSYRNNKFKDSLAVPSDSLLVNRRLSGVAAAHQTLRQVHSAHASLHGSREDMALAGIYPNHPYSDSESNIYMLSDEVKKLSSQVSLMKLDQENHDDKQKRLRDENRNLVNRINGLEEVLENQKLTALQTVEEEAERYRRELMKIQKSNAEHIDQLQIKLSEAEREIENLKTVEPMLRKEIELSLEERRLTQKKVEELQSEIVEKEKEIEQLKYKYKLKCDELEREKIDRADEIMLLSQEVESLRHMKSAAISNYDEMNDLAKQLEIIKRENDELKRSKDEMKNQILEQRSDYELEKHKSLADELMTADKGDVLDALREAEDENYRLRQYIDQLLMLIMQADPMLLEK